MIAGVETPSSGQIFVDEELTSSASFQVPPERRSIGLMFQDFALFPHLNIQQNVYFGLAGSKEFKQKRSLDLLDRVGLAHLALNYKGIQPILSFELKQFGSVVSTYDYWLHFYDLK